MSNRGATVVACLFLAGALALTTACSHESSTEPVQDRLPNAASLIPTAPAPQPTATPATPPPSEDPDPWPATPGGTSGTAADCGEPTPPAVASFGVKVHGGSGDRLLLDSTPLVGPDVAYCRQIGYTDGRAYCPVRQEGSPERLACEAARVGRASDTGRVGPTWTVDGRRCDGSGGGGTCVNHPTNQFQVYASGAGTFRACAANGACGELRLP